MATSSSSYFPEILLQKDAFNKKMPVTYYIIEKLERPVFTDPDEDDTYEGKSVVCVMNVPQVVEKDDVECWIRCGIATEDPALNAAKIDVEKCVKKIENIERKLEQVPFMQTKSEDFKEASKERKVRGNKAPEC